MAQLQNKEDTTKVHYSSNMIEFWGYNSLLLDLIQNYFSHFGFRIYLKNSADWVIYKLVGKYNNRTILIVWRGTSCQGLRKWRGGLENPKSIFSFHKWNHEVTNDVLVKIDNFSQIRWVVATNKLTYFRSISKWSKCSHQRLSKVIVRLKRWLILVATNILSWEVARFHCRSTQGRVRMTFKARKSLLLRSEQVSRFEGGSVCWQ